MKYLNGIIFFGFYKLMSQTGDMGLISWRAAALTCQFQVLILLNLIIFAERKFDLNFVSGNIYYYASGVVFTLINLYHIFHNDNWKCLVDKYDRYAFGYKISLSIGLIVGTITLFLLMIYQFSLQ